MFRDFSPEIDAGVALLDRTAPGWLDAVDLHRLDLSDAHSCVLAQVADRQWPSACQREARYGGRSPYRVGLRRLGLDHGRKYGFCLPEGYWSPWYWRRLTRQWKRRIRQLRAERAARAEYDLAR